MTLGGKTVLIGSRAASHWFPDYRPCGDVDMLWDGPKCRQDGVEYHDGRIPGLDLIYSSNSTIASPEHLYTLKLSHAFWNIHWSKTASDIKFFQQKGVQHNPALLDILYKTWTEIHGKKPAYLGKTNEEFFKDGVDRVLNHDKIHESIAYGRRPLYESIKPDLSMAAVSRGMFEALPHFQQLQLCREEIYVTALERFLVPKNFFMSRQVAYQGAARLLCTSMCKGWFPRFIILNWLELSRPDVDFVSLFKQNHKD